jgi:hypothetical protein
MAGVLYVLLAAVAARTPSAQAILGFSRHLRKDGEPAPVSASETAV